jgi:hypothetical protein
MDRVAVDDEDPVAAIDRHGHVRNVIGGDVQLLAAQSTHPSAPELPH